jgi:hypothetical protein
MVSDGDLARTVAALQALTGHVEQLAESTKQLALHVKNVHGRLSTLEERFREHGHIGESATVGLGSCWDGS